MCSRVPGGATPPPAPRTTWHQWRLPQGGISRPGHRASPGRQKMCTWCVTPKAHRAPSKPSGGQLGPVPPQDPRAYHDPSGDSPLQALRWHPQQPCRLVDLGPAGHGSHLLGLPLDRGGRGRESSACGMATAHRAGARPRFARRAALIPKAHRSGQVGAGSGVRRP